MPELNCHTPAGVKQNTSFLICILYNKTVILSIAPILSSSMSDLMRVMGTCEFVASWSEVQVAWGPPQSIADV